MMFTRRDLLISGGGLLLASTVPARPEPAGVLQGTAFSTSWRLVTHQLVKKPVLRASIETIIQSVDKAMSPFRTDSEISQFNRTATTDWQSLSAETCEVAREALRVAAMTSDAFNPTVGPIVGRFGFGPIKGTATGQSRDIAVEGGKLRKRKPDLSIDLCGIAKGYALDCMATACEIHGITDYLFELGGEVIARGRHPAGRDWRVGIEQPLSRTNRLPRANHLQRVIVLNDMALATSGTAINSYRIGHKRYSHIIDPHTRQPSESALASVSVVDPTAMTADALATALFVMGPRKGPAFAQQAGIDALFLIADGDRLRERTTAGFAARIHA